MGWFPCSGTSSSTSSSSSSSSKKKKRRKKNHSLDPIHSASSESIRSNPLFKAKEGTKDGGSDHLAAQTFTFREMAAATKNFRGDCLLGEGGFGRVYKGRLDSSNQLWELKMMQAGAILNPTDRSVTANLTAPGALTNTVRDLNVPYDGPEEYETPTADLLFPPTPLQTPMHTPLPA